MCTAGCHEGEMLIDLSPRSCGARRRSVLRLLMSVGLLVFLMLQQAPAEALEDNVAGISQPKETSQPQAIPQPKPMSEIQATPQIQTTTPRTQGDIALEWSRKLGLGDYTRPDEAVFELEKAGIKPSGGWQPDALVTGAFMEEFLTIVAEAVQNGKVKPSSAGAFSVMSREPNAPLVRVVKPAREEASAVEKMISGNISFLVSSELKQFGYETFASSVSTFAPVADVPVGPDYIVGPGDSFVITVWGRTDGRYPVTVDRNGEITLPEVGVLSVGGMPFAKLESFLQEQLSKKLTDFRMSVSMSRLRTMTVYVVGEVKTPGSYTISAVSTVFNAVFAAGGPTKNGSLRNLQLVRGGQTVQKIDLYDFLLGGDRSKDARLQSGDSVLVPVIGPVFGVAGNVKRPAIYEIKEPLSLAQAIELAGGPTSRGSLQRVQLERVQGYEKRIIVDRSMAVDANGLKENIMKTAVQDGDLVKVFAVLPVEQNVVSIEGHVYRPGKYELKPGMRLRDVVGSYEALLPEANLEHGEIVRLVEPDYTKKVIPFNIRALLSGDESQNLPLVKFDTIRVFKWNQRISQAVTASGEVFRPGEYRLRPGMRVSDLIDLAGGLRKNAYIKTAELIRYSVSAVGMTTEKVEVNLEAAVAGDPAANVELADNDHLLIRPIPEVAMDHKIEITGEVRFPGEYPIVRGEKLSDVLERAGGFTSRAYPHGAVFTRVSAKVVQREKLDRLIDEMQKSVLADSDRAIGGALSADEAKSYQESLRVREELLAKLKSAKVDGRVIIHLADLKKLKGSQYDMTLEDGDKLTIPDTPGIVSVLGEVYNPASIVFQPGKTVNYYLNRVGGPNVEADTKAMSVIRADGTVISNTQKNPQDVNWDSGGNRWVFGGFNDLSIEPGDSIVVPRKIDRFFWLRTTKDITQILFQIAVSAGIVLAI
jgi:polysaccharide export outer membrane protein